MIRLLSSFLILLLASCASVIEHNRSIEDHYVLIFIGAEARKPLDPVDKNVFALEAAFTYDEFRKRGVPKENIFVLYSTQKPDFSDSLYSKVHSDFIKEFKSSYSNHATVSNLIQLERVIESRLSSKSVFHIVLNAHGRVDSSGFYMHSEKDNRFVRADLLNEMIEDNRGYTHLYVGSCYSGQLLKEIDEGEGIIVTGANDKGSCWLDRDNSFGRLYFSNLPADLNPLSYQSGFLKAKSLYQNWGREREHFIHNVYKTKRKGELKTLVWDPQIKDL